MTVTIPRLIAALTLGLVALRGSPSVASSASTIHVSEGTHLAFALSPDRTQIVLDLQGVLYVLPTSGGDARPITDTLFDARQPTWSPDGRTIAFQSNRDGRWRIWLVEADGSNARPLSNDAYEEREPSFAPDGRSIAFTSNRGGKFDVWSRSFVDGSLRRLSAGPGGNSRPSWSPDGRQIAYVSDRPGATGIYVVGPGGRERQVAHANVAAFGMNVPMGTPTWLPDGRQVLYARIAEGSATIMSGDTPLFAGEDYHPFRMAWLSAREVLYAADGRLKRRDVEGGDPVVVPFRAPLTVRRPDYARRPPELDFGGAQLVRGVQRAVLSPDGRQIAFTALGDLWLMSIGSSPRRVTAGGPFVTIDPAWSPDGTRIAYASDRAGSLDLWILDVAKGTSERATTAPGAELRPAWSPDGRRLVYVDGSGAYRKVVRIVEPGVEGSTQIVPSAGESPGFPAWMPDGRSLLVSALASASESQSFVVGGYNQAAVVPISGGSSRPLTLVRNRSVGNRSGDGPVLSPDGRTYAFQMDSALWVLAANPDGTAAGAPRKLADIIPTGLSWAADSRTLLAVTGSRMRLFDVPTQRVREVPLGLTWHRPIDSDAVTLRVGRLVDGVRVTAVDNVDIVIEGGRIRSISPAGSSPVEGKLVDASRLTAMPGLVDMHVHLIKDYGARFGRIFLAHGITAIRSPGNVPGDILEEREAIAAGVRPGPRIFANGYILDGRSTVWEMGTPVADAVAVDRQVAHAVEMGFDMVKSYVHTSEPIRERIVAAAHAAGLPVSSHEIYPAAFFGSDSLEHLDGNGAGRGYSAKTSQLNVAYDDVVQILARSGMSVTPTTSLFTPPNELVDRDPSIASARDSLQPSWVRASQVVNFGMGRGAEELVARIRNSISKLHRAGVRIVMGTDAPFTPAGINLHNELRQAVRAGLTPFEALRAATIVPAEVLGVERDLGTLEPGKLADLVLVDGNPLETIDAAGRVRYVMTAGRLYGIDEIIEFPAPLTTPAATSR